MKSIEDELIDTIRRAVGEPGARVIRGIGDDAAVLTGMGRARLLLASDMMVEGVHFRREWTAPAQLGWKVLAVNLSDIAAMGGSPRAALVSLGLPPGEGKGFVREFYRGMTALARRFGVDIVGGDTVRAAAVTVDVAILGEAEAGRVVFRSGAKAGDVIMVTGTLGDSAAGLKILAGKNKNHSKDEKYLIKKHFQPLPRVAEGREAAAGGASAMMDLSDGLAADLPRLARASGAGARVFAENLPLSPALRGFAGSESEAVNHALTGGEDYELLICAPKNKAEKLSRRITEKTGTKVTAIGEVVPARRGCRMVSPGGKTRPLPPPGFSHFG